MDARAVFPVAGIISFAIVLGPYRHVKRNVTTANIAKAMVQCVSRDLKTIVSWRLPLQRAQVDVLSIMRKIWDHYLLMEAVGRKMMIWVVAI